MRLRHACSGVTSIKQQEKTMKDLTTLHAEYLAQKKKYDESKLIIQADSKDLEALKMEQIELRPLTSEIERRLKSAARGGSQCALSAEEFAALKTEKVAHAARLQELTEIIPVRENSKRSENSSLTTQSRHIKDLLAQITNLMADSLAISIVENHKTELEQLMQLILARSAGKISLTDGRNIPQDTAFFYNDLCGRLLAGIELPEIHTSTATRDKLLESLA